MLKYGLIGHPVKHSLSPAMHKAAFKALGMDADYLLYDVQPSGLVEFFEGVRASGISGFNITIPHKICSREYLERKGSVDENARRLGAVNTVKVADDGSLCGFNTDGPGFYRSLVEDLGFEPEGKNIFVLGSGGAARAVVMYLGNGPGKIFIHDVDAAKAESAKEQFGKYFDSRRLSIVDAEGMKRALAESDLFVNATPVGMNKSDPSPVDVELLRPGSYVYDLVYNRPATELVSKSASRKIHSTTGIGMLLYQGAIAFEIWTGAKAPIAAMRKALKEGLGKI